ncbi:hypothetical protein ACTMU2_21335 [Cupriavidus basilensis]
MLSPHEIAALLLLGDVQDIDDLEPRTTGRLAGPHTGDDAARPW